MAALLSPSGLPGKLMLSAVVTARAALPQKIRVETLIGRQAEFEITN